jgi:hypothetical protein
MQTEITIKLANAFSAEIRQVLSPETVEDVNLINALSTDEDVCATHDYCDPNQCMLDAWEKVMNKPFPFFEDSGDGNTNIDEYNNAMDITNAAWDIAKKNLFNQVTATP